MSSLVSQDGFSLTKLLISAGILARKYAMRVTAFPVHVK